MENIKEVDDIKIVYLNEELNYEDTQKFENLINDLLNKGCQKIIINMKDTDFINSTFLGMILKAYKDTKNKKGELVLSELTYNVMNLLTITRVDSLIKIFKSEIDAITYLKAM